MAGASEVSDAEIERIFRSLDRIEARLTALEKREAAREGADQKTGNLVRLVFGVAGMAAAISAVVAFILDKF